MTGLQNEGLPHVVVVVEGGHGLGVSRQTEPEKEVKDSVNHNDEDRWQAYSQRLSASSYYIKWAIFEQ